MTIFRRFAALRVPTRASKRLAHFSSAKSTPNFTLTCPSPRLPLLRGRGSALRALPRLLLAFSQRTAPPHPPQAAISPAPFLIKHKDTGEGFSVPPRCAGGKAAPWVGAGARPLSLAEPARRGARSPPGPEALRSRCNGGLLRWRLTAVTKRDTSGY